MNVARPLEFRRHEVPWDAFNHASRAFVAVRAMENEYMTKIRVRFGDRHAFDWEGGEADVHKLLNDFERLAASKRIDPTQFAEAAVSNFPVTFRKGDAATRRAHLVAVLYRLLTMDTGDPEHPGRCADYVATWDFEFGISISSSGVAIEVRGYSWTKQ